MPFHIASFFVWPYLKAWKIILNQNVLRTQNLVNFIFIVQKLDLLYLYRMSIIHCMFLRIRWLPFEWIICTQYKCIPKYHYFSRQKSICLNLSILEMQFCGIAEKLKSKSKVSFAVSVHSLELSNKFTTSYAFLVQRRGATCPHFIRNYTEWL